MSEANKALVMRWFEDVWNQGRREAIAEMLTPDAVLYEANQPSRGPDGFYPFFDRMQATFSNIHMSIHDAIAEGDKVLVRWFCTMTHTGDGLGMPPTGKNIEVSGMSLIQVANGKLINGWQNWDMLGMMQQVTGNAKAPTYVATSGGMTEGAGA